MDTGIPTKKATRSERPDTCLHCALMTTIENHFKRHGVREGDKVVIDVLHALGRLSECAVELIQLSDDRSQRRRAMRFAHDALDASAKSSHTKTLHAVDIPAEH